MTGFPLFEIIYHRHAAQDLPSISKDNQNRIKHAVENKLGRAPQDFGEPLRRSLKGHWKLRVGDWRVIYKIEGKTVIVLRIGHRREIYER